MKFSYSKSFYNTNIEEVMKFYNLGNKSFETDFRLYARFYSLFRKKPERIRQVKMIFLPVNLTLKLSEDSLMKNLSDRIQPPKLTQIRLETGQRTLE